MSLETVLGALVVISRGGNFLQNLVLEKLGVLVRVLPLKLVRSAMRLVAVLAQTGHVVYLEVETLLPHVRLVVVPLHVATEVNTSTLLFCLRFVDVRGSLLVDLEVLAVLFFVSIEGDVIESELGLFTRLRRLLRPSGRQLDLLTDSWHVHILL